MNDEISKHKRKPPSDAKTERKKERIARQLRLYKALIWPYARVVAWIAFRDPLKLEDTLGAVKRSVAFALIHDRSRLPSLVAAPERALVDTLLSGRISAVLDGAELAPRSWLHPTEAMKHAALARADVLKVWPPGRLIAHKMKAVLAASASPLAASTGPALDPASRVWTIAAETRCQAWLCGMMKAGPPTKNKPEYLADAQKEYKVSIRAFDRAWGRAITETGNVDWTKPGRKS